MKLTTLQALYVDELKNLYDAESQLMRALPKMAKAASAPQLRTAFTDHLHQSQVHLHRLDQIFLRLGVGPKGSNCRAIEGLIAEGKDLLGEEAQATVMDAALIATAQRLEHLELAGYSSLGVFARKLGHNNAADIFQEIASEKQVTTNRLTTLAETIVSSGAHAANGRH